MGGEHSGVKPQKKPVDLVAGKIGLISAQSPLARKSPVITAWHTSPVTVFEKRGVELTNLAPATPMGSAATGCWNQVSSAVSPGEEIG